MRRRTQVHLPRSWNMILLLGSGLFLLAITAFATSAQATPSYQEDGPSNDFCLACHQEQGIALTLGSETLPVTINPTLFGLSVHAERASTRGLPYKYRAYPHPDVKEKVPCLSLYPRNIKIVIRIILNSTGCVHQGHREGKENAPFVQTATTHIHKPGSLARRAAS